MGQGSAVCHALGVWVCGRTIMTSMVGIVDRRLARRLAVGRAWRILLHGLAIPRRTGVAGMLCFSPPTPPTGAQRGVRSRVLMGVGCLATGQLGEGKVVCTVVVVARNWRTLTGREEGGRTAQTKVTGVARARRRYYCRARDSGERRCSWCC